MDSISTPLRGVTRFARVEDDPEKQLLSTQSGACTSSSQATGHPTPRLPQTQPLDRVQDVLSSETQLRGGESQDSATSIQSNPRNRVRRPIRMSASSTGTDHANQEGSALQRQHEQISPLKSPHAVRKEQLQRALDPLISLGSSTLLLCSGDEDGCRIIPAQIRHSADSTSQWNEAQLVWNKYNMSWRSWLPWYGVKSVTVVKVKIAGKAPRVKQEPKQLAIFTGMYRVEQTEAKVSLLGDMDPYYFDPRFECELHKSKGTWGHDNECPSTCDEIPGLTCPYESHVRDQRYLSRLQSRPFLHILFCNPTLAAEHESMDELELLISHGMLLKKLEQYYRPNLGDLSFSGLLIREGWLLSNPRLALALIASMVLCFSVVIAWLIYHDWAVAWQVGGCFLTFATFVCGCIQLAL